jgi:hypothetical protein
MSVIRHDVTKLKWKLSFIRHDVTRPKQDLPKKLIPILGDLPLFLAHFPPNLSEKNCTAKEF